MRALVNVLGYIIAAAGIIGYLVLITAHILRQGSKKK